MMTNKLHLSKPYLFILPIVLIIGGILVVPTCYNYYISSDGEYGPWSPWSKCLKYCGDSYKGRYRECITESNGFGKSCGEIGPPIEREHCKLIGCPVDGAIGQWGEWSECNRNCRSGKQKRVRRCDNPKTKYFGKPCDDDVVEYKACPNKTMCPIDGRWGAYKPWSKCPVTCGGGVIYHERACTPPRYGGRDCKDLGKGNAVYTRGCAPKKCPTSRDGKYGPWGAFSPCTMPCGGGVKARARVCIPPTNGGKPCQEGKGVEAVRCNTQACPANEPKG